MKPTYRPKSRRAPWNPPSTPEAANEPPDDWADRSAPGHQGGSFTQAPYWPPVGRGGFGFRQTS